MEQKPDQEAMLAFTRQRVARLAGVSVERLDYWDRTKLTGATLRHRISGPGEVRLYSYADLLDVLIIAELENKDHRLSKRYIREIVDHVRKTGRRMGQLTWAIAGSRVHFQDADGRWEDGERSQFVAVEVLNLSLLHERIQRGAAREEGTEGRVEKRRGAMGSKQVVAGTRVPVATIQRYLDQGFSVDRILKSFPVLTEQDVEAVRLAS